MNERNVSRNGRRKRHGRIGPSHRLLGACLLLLAVEAGGQQITAQAIVSGGGVSRSAGGCRVLSASFGEAVVGRASGGDYVVTAGFTAATAATPRDAIFHDGFQECQ